MFLNCSLFYWGFQFLNKETSQKLESLFTGVGALINLQNVDLCGLRAAAGSSLILLSPHQQQGTNSVMDMQQKVRR